MLRDVSRLVFFPSRRRHTRFKCDWSSDVCSSDLPGSTNVEGDLLQAMLTNPHLQVEVENGIYDLATPFMATEYTMEHLGLPDKLQKNIRLQYYDAGHMMYLRDEDLAKLKTNIGTFIDGASKQ